MRKVIGAVLVGMLLCGCASVAPSCNILVKIKRPAGVRRAPNMARCLQPRACGV